LARNSNGTYSPEVSSEPLVLSGGGTGPLATMNYGRYSLALTAPMRLPPPVISGNAAAYRNVLPGVDLVVRVSADGGFSDVLVIRNAAAAANPALRSVKPGVKTVVAGGLGRVDRATGMPVASTGAGPGEGARVAPLGVKVAGSRLTLTPDRALLTGSASDLPVYLDPSWVAAGASASSWAYVSSDFPNQQYYNTSSYLQAGQNPDTGGTSYAFYTLPIPSAVKGATIHSVTAYFPEVWSDSCSASAVNLYAMKSTISSKTTYNAQPAWGSGLGSGNVAYGWSSTGFVNGPSNCPFQAKDVSFSGSSLISALASPTTSGSLVVGLKATDTSDSKGWKLFANSGSGTSGNGQGGSSVLGNGNVDLKASVSDSDGSNLDGDLTVAYAAYAAGSSSDTFATNSSWNSGLRRPGIRRIRRRRGCRRRRGGSRRRHRHRRGSIGCRGGRRGGHGNRTGRSERRISCKGQADRGIPGDNRDY
jgi:hypothetical protein